MTSPVRDSTHQGTTSHTGGTTGTISVTCSAGAIVVLAITSDITSSGSAFTNSMAGDTSGLAWTHVGSAGQSDVSSTTSYSLVDVWIGKATGALTAATVTVTASTTVDDWAISYSSYTGQASSPLDPSGTLPVEFTHNTGGIAASVGGVSTSNADDMIIMVWGSSFNSSASLGTLTPSGASSATSGGTNGGTHFAFQNVIDYSVSTTQSNITIGGSTILAGWQAVVFALTADASGASYTASQFFMGM
jgi:hypothetical protein